MKYVLATVTAAVALFVTAAPAHADQYDFISELDAKGVSYTSITGMIDVGKRVCHDLRMGYPVDAILNAIAAFNFPQYDSVAILLSASRNMCPDTMPQIAAFANGGSAPPLLQRAE